MWGDVGRIDQLLFNLKNNIFKIIIIFPKTSISRPQMAEPADGVVVDPAQAVGAYGPTFISTTSSLKKTDTAVHLIGDRRPVSRGRIMMR
jgi:hypothetical protein